MWSNKTLWAVATLLFVGFLVGMFSQCALYQAFEEHINRDGKAQQYYDSAYKTFTSSHISLELLFGWIGRAVRRWRPDGVTAGSTVIIAVFTIVLGGVTCVQANLTQKTIRLARDEFVATHRPRLGVRFFETFNEPTIAVRFTFINQGETEATVVAIAARIVQGMAVPTRVIFTEEDISIRLESGQSDTHRVVSSLPNPNHPSNSCLGLPPTFCVGFVRYIDASRIVREMGFCREWAFINDFWYVPSPIPEYEYSY